MSEKKPARSVSANRTRKVLSTTTGTIHPFDAVVGMDIMNKGGMKTEIRTKLFNLCAMPQYERKSMEELRFEDYRDSRKSPLVTANRCRSSYTNFSFGQSTTNQTTGLFGLNAATTFPTFGVPLFGNKSTTSTAPSSSSVFGVPKTAIASTHFTFTTPPSTNLSTPFSNFAPTTCFPLPPTPPLLTFGSGLPPTNAPSTFSFASAIKELNACINGTDGEKTSNVPEQTSSEKKCSRPPSPETVRSCMDCENPPQVQCLHCSKQVCMECAQKHVTLATTEIEAAQQVLTDKISVLDRLATAAKERVNTEREMIIQQADTERDQAFIQIDQLFEEQKKDIQNKSTQLSQLPLNRVFSCIQRLTDEMKDLTDDNKQLFCVTGTPCTIQVQHQHSPQNTK